MIMAKTDYDSAYDLMASRRSTRKFRNKPLTKENAGTDVQFDTNGNAFVEVDKDRLYNIYAGKLGINEIRLSSDSPEFRLYTFTFGG